jgi:hypothetical protein
VGKFGGVRQSVKHEICQFRGGGRIGGPGGVWYNKLRSAGADA